MDPFNGMTRFVIHRPDVAADSVNGNKLPKEFDKGETMVMKDRAPLLKQVLPLKWVCNA